jgi:phytoene dehydrogenase-like protein
MSEQQIRPVIVGAGHNGLVAAFYLARAGFRPLVLERRRQVGGAAGTHEIHPGFRVPTLAHAVGPLRADIENDMALATRGVQVICPRVSSLTALPDGRAIVLARDAWSSARYLSTVSEHDAAIFPEFEASIRRIGTAVATIVGEPPLPLGLGPADWWRALRTLRPIRALGRVDGHRLLRWMAMPVADFVEEWFHSNGLRATIATRGLFGVNLGPRSGGTTANLLLDAARQPATPGAACFIAGGPGALTRAMADAAAAAGAEIRVGTNVTRIDADDSGVRAVHLEDGRVVETTLVLSNADPVRTFLGLLDPAVLGPEFVSKVQHFRISGVVAKLNLALDRLPRFTAAATLPSDVSPSDALGGRILIAPDIDYLERSFDAVKYGVPSEAPWLECTIPTIGDPALAPAGKHVMSIYAQYVPHAPKHGWSDVARHDLREKILSTLEAYAPGLTASVVAAETWTPADIEREFAMTGGHPHHGDMALDQLYFMRPFGGWASYRTPIDGLYLCGAGTHPGGGLTGANGAIAAAVVLSDRNGRRRTGS